MTTLLEQQGWVRSVPFEGDKPTEFRPSREGLISENLAPCIFEGTVSKTEAGWRVLEGLLQRSNVKNKNGRIYPASILERETNAMAEIIKENGGILGELDHPETVNVNMKLTCQKIDHLQYKNGIVEGRIILRPDLPYGTAAIGCCDALNGRPGQSSRGAGSLFTKGGDTMVGEDYRMKTYDMVHDNSTHGARPKVVEEALIREFMEFSKLRPSSQKIGLASLVDRWLGLK